MRSGTFAFALLSLFTTEQRATEIEGDLLEEATCRGRSWFAIHLIGTALALFKESYRQAPLRITALGLAATSIAVATCGVIARLFAAPDAFYPEPLLGLVAIPAFAFVTGFGLGYLGSGLGVRAAAFTTIVLTLVFVVAQVSSRTAGAAFDFDAGLVLALLTAILSTLGQFVVSIVIYLAPLMAGSVYGNSRLS
jgi:hypothetical protein